MIFGGNNIFILRNLNLTMLELKSRLSSLPTMFMIFVLDLLCGFQFGLHALAGALTYGPAQESPAEPVAGPLRRSGLTPIGRIRVRRSEEISESPWGVACHWIADAPVSDIPARIERLARLGAKWALLVPDWNAIETEPGRYQFDAPTHRFDEALRGIVARGIKPILQIYGGNRLYMPEALDANFRQTADAETLLEPPAREAWLRFVEELVRRYGRVVKTWEIWNEPNSEWFWASGRRASVAQYARLVRSAGEVIRRVNPQATIVAGATAMVPVDYFDGLLKSEAAATFDFCSVHPYGVTPEDSVGDIRMLQQLLTRHGRPPVVWQTECGLPSRPDTAGWGFGGPWDEMKHAKWILRRMLTDAILGMPVSIYFVLEDYPGVLEAGPDKGKRAYNRKGLYVAPSGAPKPGAYAFQHLASLVDERWQSQPLPSTIEVVSASDTPNSLDKKIFVYTAVHRQCQLPLIAYWIAVPVEAESFLGLIRLRASLPPIPHPVLSDLLDGFVYRVDCMKDRGAETVFEALPVADSPVVLCSRSCLELLPAAIGP
ncbi:MAG: hypothetical protein RMJ16_15065 [Thermoguttaceae bacterium]|nr:hypothetical protein [Thermoguttaceae bacterium]